jgi:hypothetical protein
LKIKNMVSVLLHFWLLHREGFFVDFIRKGASFRALFAEHDFRGFSKCSAEMMTTIEHSSRVQRAPRAGAKLLCGKSVSREKSRAIETHPGGHYFEN